MKLICSIYKSSVRDEMYLYVEKKALFSRLPEKLLAHFGTPEHFGDLLLHADRKLARADVEEVMLSVQSKGFYLQMPPPREEYLLDLLKSNQDD